MNQFRGKRIVNEKVTKTLDNHQLLHYEFTNVEKTLETIHGDAFREYRARWNAASELREILEMPLYVVFETNSYCNMKCKMCTRNFFTTEERVNISEEIVDRIISQCQKNKIPSIFVGASAECLIHPDIKNILGKMKSTDALDCFLITNGYNLTEDIANYLIDIQFERVYVSLDAAKDATYKKIRGEVDLARVEGNLNRLLELRKRRNSVLPLVRVSYVMQEENKDEQEEFFEKWKDKVDIIDYQCLIDYSDWDVLKEPEELPLPEIDFKCLNPFREILINYKGDIFPCCNNYGYYMPIGNIMEMDLEQAWNCDRMKQLRNSILNTSLCKVCRNCVAHNSVQ